MAKSSVIITTVFVAALITLSVLVTGRLRQQEIKLRAQAEQIQRLQAEKKRQTDSAKNGSSDSERELLKLRGEIGVLKRQLSEAVPKQPAIVSGGTEELGKAEQEYLKEVLRQEYLTQLKMRHAKNWMLGFAMYAAEHEGQCPTHFAQAARYLKTENPDDTLLLVTNEFSIVHNGPLHAQNTVAS